MKIAYLDCFSGISGDMTIAAFLDAGLGIKRLSKELAKLKLKGYEIKVSRVKRGEIVGTKFDVIVKPKTRTHRKLKDIIRLIEKSSLNKKVKKTAKDIFTAIGRAEAKVHGVTQDKDIDFHELGQIDSIIDIVGTAIAVDELGIDEVYASNINLGRTFVNTSHGTLPIPGPASLELLKGVSVGISSVEAELVTPTGAGILKVLSKAFGEMPRMKVSGIGYGAGSKDLKEIPNMLRVMIGERAPSFKEDRIFVIETNIDDMNPQNFEYVFDKLFGEGALDVYASNVIMKKSRPAFKLTVLVEQPLLEKILSVIFSETTSIGVRYYEVNRAKLGREIMKVSTRYGDVRIKLARDGNKIFTASPEYEDCVKLARAKKIPLKVVYDEAKKAVKI